MFTCKEGVECLVFAFFFFWVLGIGLVIHFCHAHAQVPGTTESILFVSVFLLSFCCFFQEAWILNSFVWLSFKHLPVSESNERTIFDGNTKSAQQSYCLVWPFSHLNNHLPSPRNTSIDEVRAFFYFCMFSVWSTFLAPLHILVCHFSDFLQWYFLLIQIITIIMFFY